VTKNTSWVDQNWSGEPGDFPPDTTWYVGAYSEEPGYEPSNVIVTAARMPTNISHLKASASDTTATITWDTDNRGNETLEYAYLYWREVGAVDWNQEIPNIPSNWKFEVQLSGLTPGTTYEYYVVVKFAGHVEKQSGVKSFTTMTVSLQPTLINGDLAEPWDGDQGFHTFNPVGWYHITDGLDGRANFFWDDGSGEENIYPPSGNDHNQVYITSGATGQNYLAQVFSVEPGGLYRFRRWERVYNGRAKSSQLYDVASTMFVDPDGNPQPGPNAQQAAEWWYWDWQTTGPWRNDDPWYWDHLFWTAGTNGKSSIFMRLKVNTPAEWMWGGYTDIALFGDNTVTTGWLKDGWNLISVPIDPVGLFTAEDYGEGGIIPEELPGAGNPVEDEDGDGIADNDAAEVFADLIAAGNYIEGNLYRYTPGVGYEAYPTQFTTIEPGRAYWLRLDYPADNTAVGEHLGTTQEIQLATGWNMIGCKMSFPVAVADLYVRSGDTLYTIQDAVAAGLIQVPFYYYDNGYKTTSYSGGQDSYLRPWYGYWVLAFQDVTLILPIPGYTP